MFPLRLVAVLLLLATVPAALQAQAQRAKYGAFTHYTDADRITDADRSWISSPATNSSDRGATLMLRCLDDGLNVIYRWDKYFAGDEDEEVRVIYRIDNLPAASERYWGLMTTHRAAWMPMQSIPAFLTEAGKGKKIVMRVTDPVDGEVLTDEFSLTGLAQGLPQLSCAQ